MNRQGKDYYKILGLIPSASPDEIRKAYHLLAKKYHPDATGGDVIHAEKFKEVNEAYQVLSDPEKKNIYDLGIIIHYPAKEPEFEPYLTAELHTDTVKLNEEFEITYRYAGEGRVFKKPEASAFVYLSSPVVDHKKIFSGGGEIKETSLTFTVCSVITGRIMIPSASIFIRNQLLKSETLEVNSTENSCFFTSGKEAGSDPYYFYMNKEQEVRSSYSKIFVYRRVVLIPRSNYASFYHKTGSALKISFTIFGIILSFIYNHGLILSFLAGSLAGGIMCHSMYLLAGVKSIFRNALHYENVKSYLEEKYEPGRDPTARLLIGKNIYTFFRMFY